MSSCHDDVLLSVHAVKEKKKEQTGSHGAFYSLFPKVTVVTSALFSLVISHVTLKERGKKGVCEIDRWVDRGREREYIACIYFVASFWANICHLVIITGLH